MALLILLLVVLGMFYALAPHRIHVSSGLGFGQSHSVHVSAGIIMLAAALYLHNQQNQAPFDDLTRLTTV